MSIARNVRDICNIVVLYSIQTVSIAFRKSPTFKNRYPRHAQDSPLKSLPYTFLYLFVGSGRVVSFGSLETLVSEHVLDLLHPEPPLIKQGAAGVSGEMPVDAFPDACSSGHLTDNLVATTVVADIGERLQ